MTPFRFLPIALLLLATPCAAGVHVRFDDRDLGVATSNDVPGAFIYDPIAGTSHPNARSASFPGKKDDPSAQVPVAVDGALTIEAFVKADAVRGISPGIAWKSRQSDAATELGVGLVELRNFNQTWHGALLTPAGGRTVRWHVGHYSSTTRLQKESLWRHVAVVYDPAAKRATCYVDYHLVASQLLESPLKWDAGPLVIGGDHGGRFAGLIDEVRATPAVLGPTQFLRARADSISNVSFISDQQIAPRDAGCLDAREHFGAAGDGKTDDTAALNAAFEHLTSKVPLAYNTLILPAGTYLVSDMLYCSRFIDIKGAGPGKTIIRLKDGVFTDPAKPRPVPRMSSTRGDPGSTPAVNGSSISLYLDGVTIDTGRGNPGAKALEYHSNNLGRLENVILRSGDGAGTVGLDLTHKTNGPALIKHVTVEGFDHGITMKYQEYSMTLEHITLRGQKVAGIFNQGNIAAIRRLTSENGMPAIIQQGHNAMTVLLDSQLTGGDAKQPACLMEGGFYALRVQTAGYGKSLEKVILVDQKTRETKIHDVAGPNLDEYISDQTVVGFGTNKGALQLPIEETPEAPAEPISAWVNVERFAAKAEGKNWAPAIQAAIDSGATTIYIPRTLDFELRAPIHLRGKIRRVVGYGRELHWPKDLWQGNDRREQTDAAAAPPPILIFDSPDASQTVVLDRLGCVHLRHASPGTLVLRSSSPDRYTTGLAGGKLFAEDVGGADWHFDHPQKAWVRQWNPESHAAGPCVSSRGATIWALGFKTEYESQKWLATAGAQTEILGSFIYPIGKIPADRPIFENHDSAMSLIYGTSVYQSNHKVHIRDRKGTETKEVGNDALKWAGSRARMDLYFSDGR